MKLSHDSLASLKRHHVILALFWSVVIIISLSWNTYQKYIGTMENVRIAARIAYQKDIFYRRWNAMHGGVYAEITRKTQPNPYLEVIERDIKAPSGKRLTLINPAYMTRQVHEMQELEKGIRSHITSLKPIRPKNKADSWEVIALKAFEQGESEVSGIDVIKGVEYMRLMRPLITEKGCLKCHSKQGYREGDIRGGISIAIPLAPQYVIMEKQKSVLAFGHGVLLFIGWLGIWIVWKNAGRRVIEREQVEDKLRESKERASKIIETALDAVVEMNASGHVISWNPNAETIFGWSAEEAIGRLMADIIIPSQYKEAHKIGLQRFVETGKSHMLNNRLELSALHRDGNEFPVEITVTSIRVGSSYIFNAFIRDITEYKRNQEIILQNEKMISIGGLAAGMAHEINNPLGGILQGVQNIKNRLSPDIENNIQAANKYNIDLINLQAYLKERKIPKFIEGIQESGKRAANIISNTLRFSRKSDSSMMPEQLNELLERAIELAKNDYNLKKKYDFLHIKIVKKFTPHIVMVPCIRADIEQVILNLLINSAQAMAGEERKEPPVITLCAEIDGDMARIEIIDNGPGMNEITRNRIFEPFFTTKPVNEGTGLGLSVSFMLIINNHHGSLEVESKPGKGAKFIIRLPLEIKKT